MTSSAPSGLTRVLLTTGFVVLRAFLAGAGGALFDFLVGAAIRVRLGADPSVLSGEAGRLFRGPDATPGAGLVTGLVEAARDDRLRDIICGGSMGKKSDGETRRVKSINTSENFDHVDYALLFIILNQFSNCVTPRPHYQSRYRYSDRMHTCHSLIAVNRCIPQFSPCLL